MLAASEVTEAAPFALNAAMAVAGFLSGRWEAVIAAVAVWSMFYFGLAIDAFGSGLGDLWEVRRAC